MYTYARGQMLVNTNRGIFLRSSGGLDVSKAFVNVKAVSRET